MTQDSPSPRDVAAVLIERETRSAGSADPVAPVANALRKAAVELSRWVGPDGCHALLTRALSRARQEHPVLESLQVISHSPPQLVGVDESIQASSASEVGAGLNAALIQLFELLGRLIGNDLTLKLAEQVTAADTSDATPTRGEDQP